jgi:thioredoxin reductase (NADPH)
MESNSHYDAIVIGAGPAGLKAGIYLSRAKMETFVMDERTVGGHGCF